MLTEVHALNFRISSTVQLVLSLLSAEMVEHPAAQVGMLTIVVMVAMVLLVLIVVGSSEGVGGAGTCT